MRRCCLFTFCDVRRAEEVTGRRTDGVAAAAAADDDDDDDDVTEQ